MGAQKNRLTETVLLSIQNICLDCILRKELQFYAQKFCLTAPLHHHVAPLNACLTVASDWLCSNSWFINSKEEGKYQKTIQSSPTSDPGHRMEK